MILVRTVSKTAFKDAHNLRVVKGVCVCVCVCVCGVCGVCVCGKKIGKLKSTSINMPKSNNKVFYITEQEKNKINISIFSKRIHRLNSLQIFTAELFRNA